MTLAKKLEIRFKTNTETYQIKEETVHFIFECDEYYRKYTDDIEIHDKLDFFEDKYVAGMLELLLHHEPARLLQTTSFSIKFLWKVVRTLIRLHPIFREYDDYALMTSKWLVKDKDTNLMYKCYNMVCSLVYESLDKDDIIKIHEQMKDIENPMVHSTYTTLWELGTD